jgi:hypothetical protein
VGIFDRTRTAGSMKGSWFDRPFERPFGRLTVVSSVDPSTKPFDELRVPSRVEKLRVDAEQCRSIEGEPREMFSFFLRTTYQKCKTIPKR